MNLRQFSMAILISALPLITAAGAPDVSFTEADFLSAKETVRNGETLVSVKLSKSGKAKIKRINAIIPAEAHTEVAGVESTFDVRVPIAGDELEMGPYSASDAAKVVKEINEN
jgi:hypothetical protein